MLNLSESLFKNYLSDCGISFKRNFPVNSHNVDFLLIKGSQEILCDVKEVRDSAVKLKPDMVKIRGGRLDAQQHIREDLKKLRHKFDRPPTRPLLLTSMNFSSAAFTALTVSRSLLGEIGLYFDRNHVEQMTDIHHLHAGHAALTAKKNKSISGVFLFDVVNGKHCLFRNPYANYEISSDFLPDISIFDLHKGAAPEEIISLSKIMFWSHASG